MKGQPGRLIADGRTPLAGAAIERDTPLRFQLNGRTINGFFGDTVLSAVLASGLDFAGTWRGASVALGERHAPPIALAASPSGALPMDRTPAVNDAEFITLDQARTPRLWTRARNLLSRSRSLDLELERPEAMQLPWLSAPAEPGPRADLLVIGGGVAGMTAALAAAKAGERVILLERTPLLGGHSRLFGRQDGEETPDEAIARLSAAISATDAITVVTRAEAISVRAGTVRAHVVENAGSEPAAQVHDYSAKHIIIATGALERLPIFPGNRVPGVVTSQEALALAHHYGVWRGKAAVFATVTNPAYRLAMLAHDAGIAIHRIFDARPHPHSRFIEFSKAYGIRLAPGILPAAASLAPRSRGLIVQPKLSMDGYERVEPTVTADRLVVSGGWQPDLTLWHMAGGESQWSGDQQRLEAVGSLAGVALAGSAAGYLSRHACLQSGEDAVAQLLGRQRLMAEERLIDPLYETPDGGTPITTGASDDAPAFLDGGRRYMPAPQEKRKGWRGWLSRRSRVAPWSLADTPKPLDIIDIAAGVQLGLIPPESAGVVALERVPMIAVDRTPPAQAADTAVPTVPSFLAGRFGSDAGLWLVSPLEPRQLEPGALLHEHEEVRDPALAIGVVLRPVENGGVALLSLSVRAGQIISLRAQDRAVQVRVVIDHHEPDQV
ncbi:FAD-dependent oxidoreductase [Devosia sp. RR2S18]|uniref:FAD-dependent oxidoreductase n=1 Tax=Devosia rhizosphaerae TaxID=3049774 RepID=UPI0025408137|nr:FAD-dependent oxidoreductase [Devosia sp. RR2S18]WIJ24356.1 FAD-binding protein [Devosia sp. RR2S18]